MRFLYVKEKVVKHLICDINKGIAKGLGDICLANISSSVLIRKMYPSKFLYLLLNFFRDIFVPTHCMFCFHLPLVPVKLYRKLSPH